MRQRGRKAREGAREGGREGKREGGREGIVGHHLGVTSLNVELRNYVISRQHFIERRDT